MKIYITGIEGILGSSLLQELKKYHLVYGCDEVLGKSVKIIENDINIKQMSNKYYSKYDSVTEYLYNINISKYKEIKNSIQWFNPDIVIHCAAMIDIARCEYYKDVAYDVNVKGTRNIAKICKSNNIKLIYISTHAVYSGNKGNWKETDKPNPLSVYAKTKLQGEKEVIKVKDHCILRSNHYSEKGGFLKWVIDLVKNNPNDPIEIFDNVYVSMLHVKQVAKIIKKVIDFNLKGLYNIGSGYYSKWDLVTEYFNAKKMKVKVEKIDYNFNTVYKRPHNITVNTDKIEEYIKMPSWKSGLKL